MSNLFESLYTAIQKVDLSLAGLIFLSSLLPLDQLTVRKVIPGNLTSWLDIFILIPGMQLPVRPTDLNDAEYPACAAMTTGYVFRVENQAAVFYLQSIGRTGSLTTLQVQHSKSSGLRARLSWLRTSLEAGLVSLPLLYGSLSFQYVWSERDLWFPIILFLLIASRLLSAIVFQQRSVSPWHGAPEPGVQGDLLILLSQDRWVRMKGLVDDLKAVTSGSWLRETNSYEQSIIAIATLLVYLAAILTINVSPLGRAVLLVLVLGQLPLLCWSNALGLCEGLQMNGRLVSSMGPPISYRRRLDLAEQLIKETGRDDWAIKLGMVNIKRSNHGESQSKEDDVLM